MAVVTKIDGEISANDPAPLRYKPIDCTGRTVLVTGGSDSIGFELSKRFLAAGARHVIVTGRSQEKLDRAKQAVPQLIIKKSDQGLESDRVELVQWITSEYPELSIVVLNAGIQVRQPPSVWMATEWKERQKELDINLSGPIHLTQLFLPHLMRQPDASIVYVTSGLAYLYSAFSPIYSATKAGLHNFVMSTRFNAQKTNVRIQELAPPAVKSNLGGNHQFGEDLYEFCDSVFVRLIAGELEFGYKLSEIGRASDRATVNRNGWNNNSNYQPPQVL